MMDLNPVTGILIREESRQHINTQGTGHVAKGADIGEMHLQAKQG